MRSGGRAVAVVHGRVAPDAPPDEQDTLLQVTEVSAQLAALGWKPVPIPVDLNLQRLADRLKRLKPAFAFNLVESLDGKGALIGVVPQLLDSMAIAYTGCSADAILATASKLVAKRAMSVVGIDTAAWIEPEDLAAGRIPEGRFIVKSVWEHASIGLDAASVVAAEAVAARLAERQGRFGGRWFAERFVEGREFNIALLEGPDGPEVLPPAEIDFVDFPADRPRIVDYAAKWLPDSFAYHHTPRRFAFPAADAALLAELRRLSLACWDAFALKGFARVDFRVDATGRPCILEINPNPCLSPDAGFAAAAAEAGLGAAAVVGRILATAAAEPRPALRFRAEPGPGDGERVAALVAACGNFQPSEIAIAEELVVEALARGSATSGYHFVFAERGAELAGYIAFGPIAGTEGAFDLYWIGVHPLHQRGGLGSELLRRAEVRMRRQRAVRVYIETETTPQYAAARAFYLRHGYRLDAELADFYRPGAGKAIFVKPL